MDGLNWNDGGREGFEPPTLGLGLLARWASSPRRRPRLGILGCFGATGLPAAGLRRGLPAILAAVGAGISLDVGLAVWTGSGLETALAALLVSLFLLAAAGRDMRGGVLLGLVASGLALTRPEGAVWVGWALVWLVWGAWVPGRMLLGFAAGLVPALAYQGFRVAFFGRFLPNPFYAKLEPSGLGQDDGLAALGIWGLAHAVWILILMAGVVRAGEDRDGRPPVAGPPRWKLLLTGLLLLQAGFVIAAGGDWMGRTRYFVPVLPALSSWPAALRGLGSHSHHGQGRRLVPMVLGWAPYIPTYTREGRRLGEWLARGRSLRYRAVTAAGAPFLRSSRHRCPGINDSEIARRPPGTRGPGPQAPSL
jgi:hypothetical protein